MLEPRGRLAPDICKPIHHAGAQHQAYTWHFSSLSHASKPIAHPNAS